MRYGYKELDEIGVLVWDFERDVALWETGKHKEQRLNREHNVQQTKHAKLSEVKSNLLTRNVWHEPHVFDERCGRPSVKRIVIVDQELEH